MSACVDLMSSNVSVNKEDVSTKLCARVLEYDLQLWMYEQLPQELGGSLAFS